MKPKLGPKIKLNIKLCNIDLYMSSTVENGHHSAIWTVYKNICFTGSTTYTRCHTKLHLQPSNLKFTPATPKL